MVHHLMVTFHILCAAVLTARGPGDDITSIYGRRGAAADRGADELPEGLPHRAVGAPRPRESERPRTYCSE